MSAKSKKSPLDWLELVRHHVGSFNYGTVEIVVHDSLVTQIEKRKKCDWTSQRQQKPTTKHKRH